MSPAHGMHDQDLLDYLVYPVQYTTRHFVGKNGVLI